MKKDISSEIVPFSNTGIEKLCRSSVELVQYARNMASRQINIVQLLTYYSIGRWIVEEQQNGENRAKYGKEVLKTLSAWMTKELGRGFSVDTLENIRKFYLTFGKRISEPLFRKFAVEKSESAVRILKEEAEFMLSWTHYLILMRIQDENERNFYEIEAVKQGWSKRELQRQYGSSLYERLLLSSDQDKVLQLAKRGQVLEDADDLVKDPYVLEFLGLQEQPGYSETELESRIIDHLQEFLMEMGKGFTFVGRQVRFSFDEDHFRVDLVLYNRLLRCFVLIDLKTEKLKHQDLGQMQMYVNYYDRYEKTGDENPTIGILLCSDKSDAMVEMTLPENSNIYASKYELYLPDKKLLQSKLKEWIEEETRGEIG